MNFHQAMAIVLADSMGLTNRTEHREIYFEARKVVEAADKAAIEEIKNPSKG